MDKRDICSDQLCSEEFPLQSVKKISGIKTEPNNESSEERNIFVASDTESSSENGNVSGSSYSKDRDTWSNDFDFVLSLIGFSVGLGNLWRFPYLAMKNGGGAFLIPFLICLVVCGFPLFFLEVSLGQFLGKSGIHVWLMFPLLKGIGFCMFVLNIIVSLYYTMIMAWTLYYLANSFRSTLPWSTCGNLWNTDNCIVQIQCIEHVAWCRDGTIQWHLVVALGVTWIILFLCIIRGVKSIGKVVYVTALLPYVLLTAFLIRGLMLDGSVDGIIYYLKPDPVKLMEPRVWIEAALQVFYSIGVGWGPQIAMASHNRFKNNCLRDSMVVCFVGEGTSIFSGLVVFTVLGFIAHELSLPIEQVVTSGPGFGFIVYPQALSRLPLPQLWSVLFFLMLLTVGVDTMFANVDFLLTAITDMFPLLRRRKRQIAVLFVICFLGFVLDLPLCYQTCFVFTLMVYESPLSGTYTYPSEWIIIGWMIAVLPLLPQVIAVIHYFITQRSQPYKQILLEGVQPTYEWMPNCQEYHDMYKHYRFFYTDLSFIQKLKVNILGKRVQQTHKEY